MQRYNSNMAQIREQMMFEEYIDSVLQLDDEQFDEYYDSLNQEQQEELTTKKIELQNEIREMKEIFNKFQENGKQQFLNEYIDSLQIIYSDSIKINFDLFDKIELTNIDLYAYKKGVPYPMVVPLFPILTNKNEIDYGKEFNF